jgi:hypothetical protein
MYIAIDSLEQKRVQTSNAEQAFLMELFKMRK